MFLTADNSVLRGLQIGESPDDNSKSYLDSRTFLQGEFIRLCSNLEIKQKFEAKMIDFEDAKDRSVTNYYTTTLHLINSAVIRMGKLTKACKVYRGIAKKGLPTKFWAANEFDVIGGVECAFSTFLAMPASYYEFALSHEPIFLPHSVNVKKQGRCNGIRPKRSHG